MSTTSTANLVSQLRTRLITFTPATGATLNTRLGGRLYNNFAPDGAAFPNGIIRLINNLTDGAYNGDRFEADLEVMLFANSRSQAQSLEDAADVCDQAMLRYVDSSSGVVFSRRRQRDSLPPGTTPETRELVSIRCVYPLVCWPRYLTQYADVP